MDDRRPAPSPHPHHNPRGSENSPSLPIHTDQENGLSRPHSSKTPDYWLHDKSLSLSFHLHPSPREQAYTPTHSNQTDPDSLSHRQTTGSWECDRASYQSFHPHRSLGQWGWHPNLPSQSHKP